MGQRLGVSMHAQREAWRHRWAGAYLNVWPSVNGNAVGGRCIQDVDVGIVRAVLEAADEVWWSRGLPQHIHGSLAIRRAHNQVNICVGCIDAAAITSQAKQATSRHLDVNARALQCVQRPERHVLQDAVLHATFSVCGTGRSVVVNIMWCVSFLHPLASYL